MTEVKVENAYVLPNNMSILEAARRLTSHGWSKHVLIRESACLNQVAEKSQFPDVKGQVWQIQAGLLISQEKIVQPYSFPFLPSRMEQPTIHLVHFCWIHVLHLLSFTSLSTIQR